MGVGATFWITFSRNVTKESEEWATFWTDLPSLPPVEGARLAAGKTRARPMGVDLPLKNKVEGLSLSTLWMDQEVWSHLQTTLGFAPPHPWCAGRYPSEF